MSSLLQLGACHHLLCCAMEHLSSLMRRCKLIVVAPSCACHLCCAFMCSSSLLRLCVLIIFVVSLHAQLLLRCCALISVITIGGALERNFNVDASASDNLSNDVPLSA
jgi:hypothetical protein